MDQALLPAELVFGRRVGRTSVYTMLFGFGEAVIAAGVLVKRVFLRVTALNVLIDDLAILLQSQLLVIVDEGN